jgi:hypothetical protein
MTDAKPLRRERDPSRVLKRQGGQHPPLLGRCEL